MARRKKRPFEAGETASSPEPRATGGEDIAVGSARSAVRPVWRSFPGPRRPDVTLRVAMDREAYAAISAHARESLEAEVGGVLAGIVCEDDEGLFVHVKAAVRAVAAREAGVSVTFTHASWTAIHEHMEHHHPRLAIVGWYHTHPGFGVEFSEMDAFVHENFFPEPTHVALVHDPLGGDTALAINGGDGLAYLKRFWVDGREFPCRVPVPGSKAEAGDDGTRLSAIERNLESVESRLTQALQAFDGQRRSNHRMALFGLFVFCIGLLTVVAYSLYQAFTSDYRPPEDYRFMAVPMRIEDKDVLLGVKVVTWELPPDLRAAYLELLKAQEAAKAAPAPPDAEQPAAPTRPPAQP